MREPVIAFVGLGANLGDAKACLTWAMSQIDALPFTQRVKASSFYGSAPIDSSGPDYINAVLQVSTCLGAPDLLVALQKIEHLAGRERPFMGLLKSCVQCCKFRIPACSNGHLFCYHSQRLPQDG